MVGEAREMYRGWLGRLTKSVLVKNTVWSGAGQMVRVGVQAAYFILIARALGVREYGAYVGVVALVAILAPFASLGSGNLLIKHVAREAESYPRHWGRTLATTVLSGGGLLLVVALGARVFLPSSIPLPLILAVGAADLIFARLLDVCGQAYQGFQRLDRMVQLQLLLSPLRLGAAAVLVATTAAPTALEWGTLYLMSSMVAGAAGVALVWRELGPPDLNLRDLGSELREGSLFSVSLSAQSIYNDIDKMMLVRLAALEAAGVYAAAYRVVDMAFLPVSSLVAASYARFFQHGVRGVRATGRYAGRLSVVGAAYGLLAWAALYALAPLLPLVLGVQYRMASEAVRWLAPLPFLKAIHYFGANALTGAGYQGTRTAVQLGVALSNVLLNLWLIPLYSWRGAAVVSVLCDALLAVGVWTMVWRLGLRTEAVRLAEDATPMLEPS